MKLTTIQPWSEYTEVDRFFSWDTANERIFLERAQNIKQERLCEGVSQWLNCRILFNLPMQSGVRIQSSYIIGHGWAHTQHNTQFFWNFSANNRSSDIIFFEKLNYRPFCNYDIFYDHEKFIALSIYYSLEYSKSTIWKETVIFLDYERFQILLQ